MPPLEKQTAAGANRRSNKPIMEKKRRARINNCLNELKNLLLEAMKKDPTRHTKLEKADILEMTVRHLRQLKQRQMALSVATDPEVVTKYKAGFHRCADEVTSYVKRLNGMETTVKRRLLDHLTDCQRGLRSQDSPDSRIYVTPSRLPNGEVALLLPRQWSNSGLLLSTSSTTSTSTSVHPFPPLTVNCSPSSSTDCSESSSTSSPSYSSSSHFHHPYQKQSTRPHFDSYGYSRSHWSTDDDDIDDIEDDAPVDLSGCKEGNRMWRPW